MDDDKMNGKVKTKTCLFCGEEILSVATKCRHCGEFLDDTLRNVSRGGVNQQVVVSDRDDKNFKFLSMKKSGVAAAFLNLFLPGAGYMYCDRVLLGICVLIISLILIPATMGIAALLIGPIVFIDGFLAADRYNKQLMKGL